MAYNFIVVARKAREVPQLKEAIEDRNLSVSKARKITSVLTHENQAQWFNKAIQLPQRKLEQEVARACPKESVPEKINFVSEARLNLQMGISDELHLKLKKAQHLESQRRQKAASLEETLSALVEFYLEKRDPLQKAEKARHRKNVPVAR